MNIYTEKWALIEKISAHLLMRDHIERIILNLFCDYEKLLNIMDDEGEDIVNLLDDLASIETIISNSEYRKAFYAVEKEYCLLCKQYFPTSLPTESVR